MKKRKPPILLACILAVTFLVVALIAKPLANNAGVGKDPHAEEHAQEEAPAPPPTPSGKGEALTKEQIAAQAVANTPPAAPISPEPLIGVPEDKQQKAPVFDPNAVRSLRGN